MSGEELKIPKYSEEIINGKEWVYWGNNNLYPNFLITLKEKAPVHAAVLKRKTDYTFGEGITPGSEIPAFGGDCSEDFYALISDYWLFNEFAINVVWSLDGKTIAKAEHIDRSKVRAGKPDAFGKVHEYYYSNDWADTRKAYNKPIVIPAYDKENPVGSQLYIYKGYSQGNYIYSKPEYISGIGWCVLDYTLQNFHVNNAQNSFAPSMSVILSGPMPDNEEERDEIWREIKSQYSGSRNGGEIFLVFAPDGSESVKIEPIQLNDADKRYLDLADKTTDMILTSHQVVSPILFGVKTTGQLGGTQELMTSYELFLRTTIEPVQKIFEKVTEKLFGKPVHFTSTAPISLTYSDNMLQAILTKDELRANIGYEPLQNEQGTDTSGQPGLQDISSIYE